MKNRARQNMATVKCKILPGHTKEDMKAYKVIMEFTAPWLV